VPQTGHCSAKTTPGTIPVVTKPALGMQVNSALQNHPHFSSKKGTKSTRKKCKNSGVIIIFLFNLSHSQQAVLATGKAAHLPLCKTGSLDHGVAKSKLSLHI